MKIPLEQHSTMGACRAVSTSELQLYCLWGDSRRLTWAFHPSSSLLNEKTQERNESGRVNFSKGLFANVCSQSHKSVTFSRRGLSLCRSEHNPSRLWMTKLLTSSHSNLLTFIFRFTFANHSKRIEFVCCTQNERNTPV